MLQMTDPDLITSLNARGISENSGQQNVFAAVISCCLSLAVHFLLILALPKLNFDLMSAADHKADKKEATRSIRLQDVRRLNQRREHSEAPRTVEQAAAEGSGLDRQIEDMSLAPDEGKTEPVSPGIEWMAGESASIFKPQAEAEHTEWEPRREILAIDREIVSEEITGLERKKIPAIERVGKTPDVVDTFDTRLIEGIDGIESLAPGVEGKQQSFSSSGGAAFQSGAERNVDISVDELDEKPINRMTGEADANITKFRPIENRLRADITTYSTFRDFRHNYFKIEITRAGPELLPVIPKDIMLIQDSSASITEKKMYFCRSALTNSLSAIGPDDRFNVMYFRQSPQLCFDKWAQMSPENKEKAHNFISRMHSEGNTDIFASITMLMKTQVVTGRPVIAILVTDGRSTSGILSSSRIIKEFSRLNEGRISVFSLGIDKNVNSYLLDLLSYCNRGGAHIVKKGRWGIPESITSTMHQLSRPVLSDVKFRFAQDQGIEVYPVLTENLYLDRPLVIYGRCAKRTREVVFQAVGQALGIKCDMIFNIAMDRSSPSASDNLRTSWAKQKVYHLIAEYTRKADPQIMKQIRDAAGTYGVDIPHAGEF